MNKDFCSFNSENQDFYYQEPRALSISSRINLLGKNSYSERIQTEKNHDPFDGCRRSNDQSVYSKSLSDILPSDDEAFLSTGNSDLMEYKKSSCPRFFHSSLNQDYYDLEEKPDQTYSIEFKSTEQSEKRTATSNCTKNKENKKLNLNNQKNNKKNAKTKSKKILQNKKNKLQKITRIVSMIESTSKKRLKPDSLISELIENLKLIFENEKICLSQINFSKTFAFLILSILFKNNKKKPIYIKNNKIYLNKNVRLNRPSNIKKLIVTNTRRLINKNEELKQSLCEHFFEMKESEKHPIYPLLYENTLSQELYDVTIFVGIIQMAQISSKTESKLTLDDILKTSFKQLRQKKKMSHVHYEAHFRKKIKNTFQGSSGALTEIILQYSQVKKILLDPVNLDFFKRFRETKLEQLKVNLQKVFFKNFYHDYSDEEAFTQLKEMFLEVDFSDFKHLFWNSFEQKVRSFYSD